MATRITDLAALSGNAAADDLLVVHDASGSVDVKATVAQLLGAGATVRAGENAAFDVIDAQSNNLDFGIEWTAALLMCWTSAPGSGTGTVILIGRNQSIADVRTRAILATNGGAGVRVENVYDTGVDLQNYSTSSNFVLSLVWVAIG